MIDFFKNNLIWTEGRSYVIACGLAALFLYLQGSFALLYSVVIVLAFLFFFFRNPHRTHHLSADNTAIVAPADGSIVEILHDPTNGLEGYAYRVSIFLSPFDVHVNWTPLAGSIDRITYKKGKFAPAFVPKSSELNERNDVVIRTPQGTVMVRQIAGMLARRIRCWVNQGDTIKAGVPFGMIKFSSRVDLFLPASCVLSVSVGERVSGGQTIMGRMTWR